jgi:hypothetical protein
MKKLTQALECDECIKLSCFNKDRLSRFKRILESTRFHGLRPILCQEKIFRFLIDFTNDASFLETLQNIRIKIPYLYYNRERKMEGYSSYHIISETKHLLELFILQFTKVKVIDNNTKEIALDINSEEIMLSWDPQKEPYSYNYSIDFFIFLLIELAKVKIAQTDPSQLEDIIGSLLSRFD